MLKIYGSKLCPDCVACLQDLDNAHICYQYCDFSEKLEYLKEFLKLRDSLDIFEPVRTEGRIGIPCLVDGKNVFLDWAEYVSQV